MRYEKAISCITTRRWGNNYVTTRGEELQDLSWWNKKPENEPHFRLVKASYSYFNLNVNIHHCLPPLTPDKIWIQVAHPCTGDRGSSHEQQGEHIDLKSTQKETLFKKVCITANCLSWATTTSDHRTRNHSVSFHMLQRLPMTDKLLNTNMVTVFKKSAGSPGQQD